jgi:hypothetical protein
MDLVDLLITASIAISLIYYLWRRIRSNQAKNWPKSEGRVETGALEVVAHTKFGQIELPVFSFSYQVGPQFYGGRFALLPYITDPGPSVIQRMIGRKLLVAYNPKCAQEWVVLDDLIEGCRVEQKLSTHLVNYPPRS